MKKFLIAIFIFGFIGAAMFFLIKRNVESPILQHSATEISDEYQEYLLDSGDDRDLGFTHRALAKLRKSEALLDKNTSPLKDAKMKSVGLTPDEYNKEGVLERYISNNDIYELRRATAGKDYHNYRMFKNNKLLFERSMEEGADGSILDWRIVNNKPAFTFRTSLCSQQSGCGTDIFYDGKFLSEEYGVKNPQYLFSSQGKLGFVAPDDNGDRIFFDGAFITPVFDVIHTHNCCAVMEILPTVYENGVLLFYGRRDTKNYGNEKNYIAEVKLK